MPDENGQHARMLFLHAQTGLHPGSGTALGTVDLPVQRERHTQWPTVPGSSLKGVLRDRCRERVKGSHGGDRRKANEDDTALTAAFGPAKITGSGDSFAGALSVTDARVLAFPVRSLRGVFAWATCPAVLVRLNRDLKLAGMPPLDVPPPVNDTDALAAPEPLRVGGNKLVLEEFEFNVTGECGKQAEWFAGHVSGDEATRKLLKSNLVVLSDDYFTHFVRNATEIVARIALDYATKTVKDGALFYQEFLPPETLFYAVVLANPSRKEGHQASADDMLSFVSGHIEANPVLQIGGDETLGKGLCFARLVGAKGGA